MLTIAATSQRSASNSPSIMTGCGGRSHSKGSGSRGARSRYVALITGHIFQWLGSFSLYAFDPMRLSTSNGLTLLSKFHFGNPSKMVTLVELYVSFVSYGK